MAENKKKILFIDAYDSFVYNLYQYFGELTKGKADLFIKRKDEITLEEIKKLDPDYIVLSPGPGHPRDSNFIPVIKEFSSRIPTFGVCLGHQSIGMAFGGKISVAENIMHGKTSQINHDGKTIFAGVQNPFTGTRYHSLIVELKSVPEDFIISATSQKDNYVMAMRHKSYPIECVQFHPESILTSEGKKIIKNFLDHYADKKVK
ncbi:Anthranilate synthase component 2 [Candidatus Gugararchaeum adminiculabundum]|nr:Anthranilate synthase component 2 [Candidatus Gugararchaeum adminiculabundum]